MIAPKFEKNGFYIEDGMVSKYQHPFLKIWKKYILHSGKEPYWMKTETRISAWQSRKNSVYKV